MPHQLGGGGGDLRDHGGEQEVHQLQIRQVHSHRHGPCSHQGQCQYTSYVQYVSIIIKYTIRSIVCEASCHPVSWVTQLFQHYYEQTDEQINSYIKLYVQGVAKRLVNFVSLYMTHF